MKLNLTYYLVSNFLIVIVLALNGVKYYKRQGLKSVIDLQKSQNITKSNQTMLYNLRVSLSYNASQFHEDECLS